MWYLGGPASEERSSNAAQLLQTHRKCGEVNLNISDIDQTPHLQNKYTGNFYNQILCDIIIIYKKIMYAMSAARLSSWQEQNE